MFSYVNLQFNPLGTRIKRLSLVSRENGTHTATAVVCYLENDKHSAQPKQRISSFKLCLIGCFWSSRGRFYTHPVFHIRFQKQVKIVFTYTSILYNFFLICTTTLLRACSNTSALRAVTQVFFTSASRVVAQISLKLSRALFVRQTCERF